MKMHITLEDLSKLTEAQKRRLSELWKPEKYDLASACICKDADSEEFDTFEFVVGNVLIDKYAHIYLNDIKAPEINIQVESDTESEKDEPEEDLEENPEEELEEEEPEEDFDSELFYSRPTCFNKQECFPLVNIGQMIDILKSNNYGEGDFYLTAGTAEIGCELGKNAANFNMYSSNYESNELCDVLWELVRTIL